MFIYKEWAKKKVGPKTEKETEKTTTNEVETCIFNTIDY